MKLLPFLGQLPLILVTFMASCSHQTTIKPDSLVVVKDVSLPKNMPAISRLAKHTYVDYRPDPQSPWRRIEIVNSSSGILHRDISDETAHSTERWGKKVRIISQSNMQNNPHFVAQIQRFALNYDASVYRAWPGPNSNTFADDLIRSVDGINAKLHHNAVGKEYRSRIGRTTSGTGLEAQTPLCGVALGVHEGIEVSLLGLSGGVSFSPPGVQLPLIPRLGPR